MSRKVHLTAETGHLIAAGIRSGGYAHVAAQAHGVSAEAFDDWMRCGSRPGAREPFRSFAREVRQAQAQARLRAETAAFANDPKNWLHHGPGRESENSPGWSAQVKAAEVETRRQLADWLREHGLVRGKRAA